MDIAYIDFYWCFCLTARFVFMLIDFNNHCSNHVMNDSVVSFVIPLSHDASPPGVSIDIIKSSTRMLVTSIYFEKA